MSGRLEIIMGCMFSGKSTELIRRLKRFKVIFQKVLVINSSKDTRSQEEVIKTHDGVAFQCIKTTKLMDVYHNPSYINAAVIGIDEGQFFEDLHEFVKFTLCLQKHIIIASLDGDSNQKSFGQTLSLIPLADNVDKLHALCMECHDGTLAPFTKRHVKGGTQELIGSNEIYSAVCRNHLADSDPVDVLIEHVVADNI